MSKDFGGDYGAFIGWSIVLFVIIFAVSVSLVAVAVVVAVIIGWKIFKWKFRGEAYHQKQELRETKELYDEVKRAFDLSPYSKEGAIDEFMFDVTTEAFERAEIEPVPTAPAEAVYEAVQGLLIAEGGMFGWVEEDFSEPLSMEWGVDLRNYLRRKKRFLGDAKRLEKIWREKVIRIFEGILGYVPMGIFREQEEDEAEGGSTTLTAAMIDLCREPAEAVERTIVTLSDDDVVKAKLFEDVREELERRLLYASGIALEDRHKTTKQIVFPTAARGMPSTELVETYLSGTPLRELFETKLSFPMPFQTRFEHTHIVGGTGHGKTQLIQMLIHNDLLAAREGKGSVVVIDGSGDLIRTVSHLNYFSPDAEKSLADKFLLIDPNDIEHPVCLNMFDVKRDRLASYSAVDRERILNGTIDLYGYLFGELLGAEMTQKQGIIFNYLARLMLHIPEATIITMRDVMTDGEPYRKYMEQLEGSARSFFETEFFDKSFEDTKRQIRRRLWGVLENRTFERMFENKENKVDLFKAMNEGKIILINTAEDLLKDRSAIFGRFFIAMILQAAIERSVIKDMEKRRSTFVYIDEAHVYIDDKVEKLLNQARKYRVGLIMAHLNLNQLSSKQKATFMTSTSIKFVGGVSHKDAGDFAQEMRCSPEFIMAGRKSEAQNKSEFACFVKNRTPHAVRVTVPLGFMEGLDRIDERDYELLLEENRRRYSADAELEETAGVARTPEKVGAFNLGDPELL